MNKEIKEIIFGEDIGMKRALFAFDKTDNNERVRVKFNLWAKYYQSKYFKVDDADFHKDIDLYNIQVYKGDIDSFVDIVFRGGAKTARTKLFFAYAMSNDLDHYRKYIKVLSEDLVNAKQIVTDIYNIFVTINSDYPEIFQKTSTKREETMGSFTTSTGVKIIADSVGTNQRGAIQDDARPDLIWYEDIENRKTLRSMVITKSIWDNMEEARTGLSKGGGCIYTCNYISEAGNVHKIVQNKSDRNIVLIIPILDKKGNLTWEKQYSNEDVERMKQNDDDFEGERLCLKPDTLIMTKKGFKRIDSLKVGDYVLTHLGNYKKILTVFKSKKDDLLDITINNKKLTITKNHPILVKRNKKIDWVSAGDLKTTDFIIYDKI